MADFCRQCAIILFGDEDAFTKDLAGLSKASDTAEGMYAQALCESCGHILVDHQGTCVMLDCPIHGENASLDEEGNPVPQ